MRSLQQSLQDEDIGRLRILAELWGLEIPQGSVPEVLPALLSQLTTQQILQEMYESLPDPEQAALRFLQQHDNRAAVADMNRKFGQIRQMGPGRRDREKPWRNPASALEMLWYRGWVSTAFDHTPTGLQEFLFIPRELLPAVPEANTPGSMPPGEPADIPPSVFHGSRYLLEDCTTLLADLRRHVSQEPAAYITSSRPSQYLIKPESKPFLIHLLKEKGILSPGSLQPDPAALRSWFETPLQKQWMELVHLWRDSKTWNDLALVPSLTVHQNQWPNDPLLSRSAILRFLHMVPDESWWDLEAFLGTVREQEPAFQRPAGDFDSWYLQTPSDGSFLTGIAAWDAVEGALIRTIIRGPLFWMGLVDLGTDIEKRWVTSFRLTAQFRLLSSGSPVDVSLPSSKPLYSANGEIHFPINSDPTLRYQVARAAAWSGFNGKVHRYYFTPESLQESSRQGLQPGQLIAFLHSNELALPPYLEAAVENWEKQVDQGTIHEVLLLQVNNPTTLEQLLKDRGTAKYLSSQLNPTSILVRRVDLKKLYSAALRLGILLDMPAGKEETLEDRS